MGQSGQNRQRFCRAANIEQYQLYLARLRILRLHWRGALANFGLGCISPWSASGWNKPAGANVVMQAPLSYNAAYPFAEVQYAAAESVHAANGSLAIDGGSMLTLYQAQPAGYSLLNIKPNLEWMSVTPVSFGIGGIATEWPGSPEAIAMVDTGGGPTFLSDPAGYLYDKQWPDAVVCPAWSQSSKNCNCTSDALSLTLGDGTNAFSYIIDTSALPSSVQGLTAVMCQVNEYMMGQYGMNIGGVSALFNDILIDYSGARVGFKARH